MKKIPNRAKVFFDRLFLEIIPAEERQAIDPSGKPAPLPNVKEAVRLLRPANLNHPVIPAVLLTLGLTLFFYGAIYSAELYFTPAVSSPLFKTSFVMMIAGLYFLAISIARFSSLLVDFVKGLIKAGRTIWVAAAVAAKG